MKLKRKLKKQEILYDISTNEVSIKPIYEHVLEEALIKKLIKSADFWVAIVVMLVQFFAIIFTKDKWFAVIYTTILYTYGIILYNIIKKIQ